MKTLITTTLILLSLGLKAQTVTVYTSATTDTLLARQARALTASFTAQITTLTNRINELQGAVNTQGIKLDKVGYAAFDGVDFITTKIADTTTIKLRNPVILK